MRINLISNKVELDRNGERVRIIYGTLNDSGLSPSPLDTGSNKFLQTFPNFHSPTHAAPAERMKFLRFISACQDSSPVPSANVARTLFDSPNLSRFNCQMTARLIKSRILPQSFGRLIFIQTRFGFLSMPMPLTIGFVTFCSMQM